MLTYTAMSELTRGRLGGSSAFSAGYVGCLRPCDGELPRAVVPMVLTHTYIHTAYQRGLHDDEAAEPLCFAGALD